MPTDRLTLLLVLHNHQPVGNLPEVFRQTFNSAYLPLVELLERHPSVRCALHYTGPLLEWLETKEPAFIARLVRLQQSGQIELLGGALYEPILAVIPDEDKVGQLDTMSDRMQSLFGRRPAGAWLAERVWEPHLPRYFAGANLHYTILDQEHFEKAGLAPDDVDGAWLTEDVGETVTLIPGSTDLRYLIPWQSVDEVMAFLWQQQQNGRSLLVFGDDGEKLGGWPGTYQLCYEEGWLEHFFSELEHNSEWLAASTPSNYLASHPAEPRIHVPSASYPEMEDWSLPPTTQQAVRNTREAAGRAGLEPRFVRMGHWRGFLARYAESNLMLQRGIAISRRVHALPPGSRKDQALGQLWRGQCNCPYWHGVFGGIYLYHIRHATFGHLVAADATALSEAMPAPDYEFADMDADGKDECRLITPEQSLFLRRPGGSLFEWDLPAFPINLLNTLATHRESYSEDSIHTGGIRPRHAFLDHLLSDWPELDAVTEDRWPERQALSDQPYRLEAHSADETREAAAVWPPVLVASETDSGLRLSKTYRVASGKPSLSVEYALDGLRSLGVDTFLAVEVNLALPPGAHTLGRLQQDERSWSLSEPTELEETSVVRLRAPGLTLELEMDRPGRLLHHPLWSRHRTELGEEKVYQGTRLVMVWPVGAEGQDRWGAGITLQWSADEGT